MHSKQKTNTLIAATLILTTLSALTLSFAAATTTNVTNSTDFLFSLIQNANAIVTEAYTRLEANATAIPQDSLTAYNQAIVLAGEAESQLQAGNTSEADTLAIQALQKFKEALRILYDTIPEQPTEAQVTYGKTVAVQSAINRCSEQIQRLENLTAIAKSTGYNTTSLEARIEIANALLANASRSLNQQDFDAASNATAEAKQLVENLLSHVDDFAATLKIQRLDSYVTQTEARLATLRTEATATQNTASLSALNSADASLSTAKEYLAKQQLNETLTALANAKESEEKAASYLNPAASLSDTAPTPSPKPSTSNVAPTKTPSPTKPPTAAITPSAVDSVR